MRFRAGLVCWAVLASLVGCGPASTPLSANRSISATAPATQSDQETNLLAMGDWGEDTGPERQVARAMARYVEHWPVPFAAVLLCGDNFYFKLTGVDDPHWQTLFEHMYDPKVLDIPFYSCLGNHDYDGNNLQIELQYPREHPDSRFKMPGRWYRVDLPNDRPMVTVIMLDSNKDNLSEAQWNQQKQWLQQQLAGPRATWTICCAHHPLFSNGFFFGNGVLQKDWGTLFEKYHVDFYLSGHEHNLQHLEIPGWHESFVIAGGGGAHAHPLFRSDRGFSREAFGFVHFELTTDEAIVRYIDPSDEPIHEFERSKSGEVKVLETTPNTPAEKNPLNAYLQLRRPRPAASQP